MIWIWGDFKPILNLDLYGLYGEHMPEERNTGSKLTVTYLAGRLTREYIRQHSDSDIRS